MDATTRRELEYLSAGVPLPAVKRSIIENYLALVERTNEKIASLPKAVDRRLALEDVRGRVARVARLKIELQARYPTYGLASLPSIDTSSLDAEWSQ